MERNVLRASTGPSLRLVSHERSCHYAAMSENENLCSIPHLQKTPGAESALEELNSLVGLNKVKELVFEIYAFAEVQKKRERAGLLGEKTVLHMVFKGNPLNSPVKPIGITSRIAGCPQWLYP